MLLGVSLVFLPKVSLVFLVMELLVGKDHSPLKILSYCSQCQVLSHPVYYPCCIHFTDVNPSLGFLIKRIQMSPHVIYLGSSLFEEKIVVYFS